MDSVFSVPPSQVTCQPHVLLFPFMSKGHTIPLLQFARLLLRRGITVTVLTTPANRHFVAQSLRHTAASVVVLPFPYKVPDLPAGIESTDKLPSMSLFYKFATATVHMQPHLERALETLPRVSFMVSDGFLWWTLHSASKFDIPRWVYYGMSCYAVALSREASISGILNGPQPDHELVNLTAFPCIRLSKNDFSPEFRSPDLNSLASQFHMNVFTSTASSCGMLVNSFYELEHVFVDYMNKESINPKSYCVGPFCLADEPRKLDTEKPKWVEWLDKKGEEGGGGVVYVAFGSQAEISGEQLKEIARGLEESEVGFLWVIRKDEWEIGDGFEERVKGRAMVVREWVEQREILMHESVKGFVSHCGWNSVLEGICAGVPILGWPVMAEQPLNARMVEEELRVGLRVERSDGTVVRGEEVREKVRELMEGERGREARKKVKEVAEMAKKAVERGGSSWRTLESLLVHTCTTQQLSSSGVSL